MKVSREQVAKNRQRIIQAAGKLFRERGFDGVSVADIMNSAGLTHGGFYGHFASKEDLAAQACMGTFARSVEAWAPSSGNQSQKNLMPFVASYLSVRHRDNPGGGCALAALVSDAARQPAAVRHAFTEGIRATAAMLSELSPGRSSAAKRKHALATLAGLVGAVTLARATDDPALSDEILRAALATFGARSFSLNSLTPIRAQRTNAPKTNVCKPRRRRPLEH